MEVKLAVAASLAARGERKPPSFYPATLYVSKCTAGKEKGNRAKVHNVPNPWHFFNQPALHILKATVVKQM